MPSRRQLSGKVLDKAYEKCQRKTRKFIRDSKWISISMDGWKNVRQDHVINFMATGDDYHTELLGIEDVKDSPQTAELSLG